MKMSKLGGGIIPGSITITIAGQRYHSRFFTGIDPIYYAYTQLSEIEQQQSVKKLYNGGSLQFYDWYSSSFDLIIFHRTDGHAYENFCGTIEWYVNDEKYTLTKEYCEAAGMDGEDALFMYLKYGEILPSSKDQL